MGEQRRQIGRRRVEQPPKRKPGRPKGTFRTIYEKPRGFRFTKKDLERLARIAAKRETSESEVMRQLIRRAAVEEGVEEEGEAE
jgi:hypothetical protein